MSRGIDLSNNNGGPVDWNGVEFAYRKATEGVGFIDATQAKWHAEAQARSIPDGPYHFAHPDVNSVDAEADFFIAHAIPGEFWALDCETRKSGTKTISPLAIMGAPSLASWCDQFYDRVAPVLGPIGFHYTFRSYADALWPRLTAPWWWWLASAAGAPKYRTYAGRAVAVEQYAIVGGVDQNESYVPPNPAPQPQPQPEDEDMRTATYMRRASSSAVVAYFDDKTMVPINAPSGMGFKTFEEVFVKTLGVKLVKYEGGPTEHADHQDDGGEGDVWVIADNTADVLGLP